MGPEGDEDGIQSHIPIEPSGEIPPEMDGNPADMPTTGLRGHARHVSLCMRLSLVVLLLIVIFASVASNSPLYTLLFAFLALLPAGIVAKFITSKLKDDAVPARFLVNQFFIGAIPLSVAVVVVELIFGAILVFTIFAKEIPKVAEAMGEGAFTNGTASLPTNSTSPESTRSSVWESQSIHDSVGAETLPDYMQEIAPKWKILLFLTLNAFIVAGFVEETGKWLVSRRFRKVSLEPYNIEMGRKVGCRGILAICSMGALGFATIENLGYVVGLSTKKTDGFPFALVGVALLRGILAFPVHVGAQFYVGVAAAQNHIFGDESRIMSSLFVAIMLHGTFDAASLNAGFFISEKYIPEWTIVLVVVFQLFLVLLLMLLCRGRYKALLERERVVLMSQEVV